MMKRKNHFLFLALIFVLAGCQNQVTENNDDLSNLEDGFIGNSLEFYAEQVWRWGSGGLEEYRDSITFPDYGLGAGKVVNGLFYFSTGIPPANNLRPIKGNWNNSVQIDFFRYDDLDYSPSETLVYSFFGIDNQVGTAISRRYMHGNFNEAVDYLFVDRDVTITGKGISYASNNISMTTIDIHLELKEGWNAINTKREIFSGRQTVTMIQGDNPNAVWYIYNN